MQAPSDAPITYGKLLLVDIFSNATTVCMWLPVVFSHRRVSENSLRRECSLARYWYTGRETERMHNWRGVGKIKGQEPRARRGDISINESDFGYQA